MKLSLKQVIHEYGSEGTKSHYEKYGRIVSTNVRDALMRTLRQHFHHVVKGKEGRNTYYELLNPKEKISEREDNRVNSGRKSVSYTSYLEAAILNRFAAFDGSDGSYAVKGSISKILEDLSIHSYRQKNFLYSLYAKRPSNEDEVDDVNYFLKRDILREFERFNDQFKRVIKRLRKKKLIDYTITNVTCMNTPYIDSEWKPGDADQHFAISDEEALVANEIVKREAELEDLNLFSVLYGKSTEKKEEIIKKRDEYIKEVLIKKLENEEITDDGYEERYYNYSESKVLYLYQSYRIFPVASSSELNDSLLKYGIDVNSYTFSNLENMISEKIQVLRKDHMENRFKNHYTNLIEKLQPFEHEEWGEQESLLKKNAGAVKSVYYEEVESGEALLTASNVIDAFFDTTSTRVFPLDRSLRLIPLDSTVTSDDSLIESEMTDPSFSIDQLDPPSPYLPMQ